MNRDQYRAAIKAVGFQTQSEAAAFFRVDVRTGRRWAEKGCPEAVGMWLRWMLHNKFNAEKIAKLAKVVHD